MNKNLKIELKPTGKGIEIRKAGGYKAYYKQQAEISKPKKTQGRNELCACGSGKKFKKCCLIKKEKKMKYNYTYNDINRMIRFLKIKGIAQMQYFFGGKSGVGFVNNNPNFNAFYDFISRSHLNLNQLVSLYKENEGEKEDEKEENKN